jgi:hypothetical protein
MFRIGDNGMVFIRAYFIKIIELLWYKISRYFKLDR